MGKGFIEERIIKAGVRLSEDRIERKGTPITADDIRKLEVRTLSPVMQINYAVIGVFMMALAIWFHFDVQNMAISVALLVIGFGNLVYVGYGKPKPVSTLEKDVDLGHVAAEIVDRFVKKMDKS